MRLNADNIGEFEKLYDINESLRDGAPIAKYTQTQISGQSENS